MSTKSVWAACFSPTGNARKIAEACGEAFAAETGRELVLRDFTLPQDRQEPLELSSEDHLILVTPVYAGRIPNKILPWVKGGFRGSCTPATVLATFGNRNCDSALGELKQELEKNGFRVISAAAIVSEHVFSPLLAPGRPDEEDLRQIRDFAVRSAGLTDRTRPLELGERAEVAPYYTPRRTDGEPAKFLKAKPVTDPEKCRGCGLCAASCPMGSISAEDPSQVPGICIKCQACIKKCPAGARHFEDGDFLSHVAMLEENFRRRASNEFYL